MMKESIVLNIVFHLTCSSGFSFKTERSIRSHQRDECGIPFICTQVGCQYRSMRNSDYLSVKEGILILPMIKSLWTIEFFRYDY